MITECRCGGSFNSNRCDSCGLDPHEPQYSYFQFASAIATEREKAAKIAENAEPPNYEHDAMEAGWNDATINIAELIRAGDKE